MGRSWGFDLQQRTTEALESHCKDLLASSAAHHCQEYQPARSITIINGASTSIISIITFERSNNQNNVCKIIHTHTHTHTHTLSSEHQVRLKKLELWFRCKVMQEDSPCREERPLASPPWFRAWPVPNKTKCGWDSHPRADVQGCVHHSGPL